MAHKGRDRAADYHENLAPFGSVFIIVAHSMDKQVPPSLSSSLGGHVSPVLGGIDDFTNK